MVFQYNVYMIQSSSMDMYETTVDNTLTYNTWYIGVIYIIQSSSMNMYETTVDNTLIYIWYIGISIYDIVKQNGYV